jgi:shikimate kinase
MNLVLIGYRGTGKSAVSEIAAERLHRRRIGMDATLVERFGQTIPQFVEKNGWDAFRDAESKLARELGECGHLVIDCGGGVVVRSENIEALSNNGRLVWLKASVPIIAQRIGGDSQRPSLTGTKSFLEEIEEVLAIRTPLYKGAAHYSVDTDDLPVEGVAEEILRWWREVEQIP